MQESFRPPERAPLAWYPAPAVPPSPAGVGRGLAIAALVLSAVALVGVLAVAVWVLAVTSPADEGGGGTGPLTGQLSASAGGGPVTGDTLASAVSARITQDGGDVSRMDCPKTPKVGQGIVTVCHGVIDLSDYAIVVYFEDQDGRFTLEPL